MLLQFAFMDSMEYEVECALARVRQQEIEIYVDKYFRPIWSVFTLLSPHADSGGWNDHRPVAQLSFKATVTKSYISRSFQTLTAWS